MSPSESAGYRAEAPRGPGLWGARIVSYVVSPLALPPLVYGAVLAHVGASQGDVVRGTGIALVFLGLVPLAYVGWLRIQGRIESLEIRDRRKRTGPFLVVLGAGMIAFVTVLWMGITGQRLLAALVACHVLNTIFLFLITTWWKISVHCASVTGAVATLLFVQVHVPGTILDTAVIEAGLPIGGVVLVLVMFWARIRSRAHTPLQAGAGTILGGAPYVELVALAPTIGL